MSSYPMPCSITSNPEPDLEMETEPGEIMYTDARTSSKYLNEDGDLDRQREAEDVADGLREAIRDIGRGLETGSWAALARKQVG